MSQLKGGHSHQLDMFYSDSQLSVSDAGEKQVEFAIHTPVHLPPRQPIDEGCIGCVTDKCETLKQQIYSKAIDKFTQGVIEIIRDSYSSLLYQYTDESLVAQLTDERPVGRECDKFKVYHLIVPVCLNRNQEKDLDGFMDKLRQQVYAEAKGTLRKQAIMDRQMDHQAERALRGGSEGRQTPAKDKQDSMDIQTGEKAVTPQPNPKEREFKNWMILDEGHLKVKSIGLKLYEYINVKQAYDRTKTLIYIAKKPTNLTPRNISVFNNGVKDCNCILILPTFSKFQFYNYQLQGLYEVIPVSLFDAREMFIQFMFQCLADQQIMAYLPREATLLLTEMQSFPVSYGEACRRLVYLIRKLHMLAAQKSITLHSTDIYKLYSILNDVLVSTMGKVISCKPEDCQIQVVEKSIICSLDQRATYDVMTNYVSKLIYFSPGDQVVDQHEYREKIIKRFRRKLSEKLTEEPNFKCYVDDLEQDPFNRRPPTAVRSRKRVEDRYKFWDVKYDLKTTVQQQIKKIFLKHTSKIRDQARQFKWSQFHYMQRIKPMIAYDISLELTNSQYLANLFDYFIKRGHVNMSTVCEKFGPDLPTLSAIKDQFIEFDQKQQRKLMQIQQLNHNHTNLKKCGKLIHMIKQLEMYGMLYVKRTNVNPVIVLLYYPKAQMSIQAKVHTTANTMEKY